MSEDTKPKDEKIPDAQPDDIPDTKPEKKRKEPLSRADYHNVIVAYVAIVLSVISLFVDVIQAFPRESIQILRVEDDGYYHFDGETLFKNFQVTVANNSAIPVSVVEITIERDGEARTFEVLPDVLPLNMEANHTEMITIPWNIDTATEDAQKIRDVFSEETLKDSDIVMSSKGVMSSSAWPFKDGILTIWLPSDDNAEWKLTTESEFADSSSLENVSRSNAVIYPEGKEPIIISEGMAFVRQSTLDLTITLGTAKGKQYLSTTQDTGAPENTSESSWVANRITQPEIPLSIRDFIEAMHMAQKSQVQSKEEN